MHDLEHASRQPIPMKKPLHESFQENKVMKMPEIAFRTRHVFQMKRFQKQSFILEVEQVALSIRVCIIIITNDEQEEI